jgi:hypothetical protein
MKATVSRRQMLATIPAATTALSGFPTTAGAVANATVQKRLANAATDDPVFAAIARHRQATQALSALHEPPEALVTQLLRAEVDAFLAWLTTPPTTLAGVIATLDHASRRAYEDGSGTHVYTNLSEAAQYDPADGDPDGALTAGEQFPAMIAAALRKISADKLL